MEENWYALELYGRDRLAEARAAARVRALIREHAPMKSRPNYLVSTVSALGNQVLALAIELRLALSRALANARAWTTHCESAATEPTRPRANGSREVRPGRGR